MSKFKVGDMVVIGNPMMKSEQCYRGFVRRISSVNAWRTYYLEDIIDEDGDPITWMENELAKVEVGTPLIEIDSVNALRYCMNDLITTNNCCEKIKEEKNMNKVVTLWYERKRKSIEKKYDKLREEFGEKQYNVVESFNELVDKFNKDLDGLFQFDKASEQFVLVNNAPNNVIKYKIDVNKLDDEFNEMYRDEIRKAYKKIDDTREEVEAQLSLSDDLKYQQEVLERYNIISKKTKKISD